MGKTRTEPDVRTLGELVNYLRSQHGEKPFNDLVRWQKQHDPHCVELILGRAELASLVIVLRGLADLSLEQFGAFVDKFDPDSAPFDASRGFGFLGVAVCRCENAMSRCAQES